ncbi:hypothetical protein AMJ39_05930 [candidate division TA06 bacterium DG_24]|uniref:ABC transporter domain-containing protein n=3 Tax=Bacteria division TA06 TaxID=1156500 RepID=A0A0S8JJZ9_UNCT6|nr:MAG: hypothetical protein AMJ39_05930 [candidate division TA06 bacterium DG_24]KPK70247.1 MAG: hypothetical protein AMJ82_03690 [candidate division TA06 bacterium SM23_40]KPL09069.1 MAG: hypothetical protein AMJ71_07400 [candidate division TA06 bacterium SM1_40]
MSTEMPVVQFRDVSFFYGASPVLTNVTFAVEPLALTYIVGPNGGGKTTLLKLILALLQPDRGEVRVFGQPPNRVRHRIGYTPQHPGFDPQFPVTVLDVVLMGRLGGQSGGPYSQSDRAAALGAMEQLEVDGLGGRLFSSLSSGERQRVLIARALATEPDLLLLDEPTSNVDVHTENRLLDIIGQLNKRYTILLVSHDLSFVSDRIKSVLCVNRQVRFHPTSDVTDDAVRQIYQREMRLIRHDLSVEHQEQADD